MYAFQSEPTLYSCLNGKELLAQSNWTRIQNHLVPKRTLNHLAKLLSVRLRTKWFCVRVQLQSFLFYFVEMFCFMEILSTNEWSFYSSLFINDWNIKRSNPENKQMFKVTVETLEDSVICLKSIGTAVEQRPCSAPL